MAGNIILSAHLQCHWNCRRVTSSHQSLFFMLFCSVCRWKHMLRYTSESLESNIWCFFNLNINTGNWRPLFRSSMLYFLVNWRLPFTVNSLYWMSQIQTVQRTAKQPSSTRKTNGSTRRGFLPSLNRAGVTVDPCFWFTYEHFGSESRSHQSRNDRSHRKKWHILNSSTWYICPLTVAKFVCCCVLAVMPAECCCWAIACVFSKS